MPPVTVFWAWDSELLDTKALAADMKRDPPHGVVIEVLGEAGSLPLGDLLARLEAGLTGASGLLAVIDTPNANMAWELGIGLCRGLRLALTTEGSAPKDDWVKGTPFAQFLRVGRLSDAVEAVLGAVESWFLPPARPKVADRRVVVCSGEGVSRRWQAPLRAAGWEVLDTRGWSIRDLPERLAGVGRLAWVMSPLRSDEKRHGVANTVGALVAGYASELGVPVRVFAPEGAPGVLDAEHLRTPVPATREALVAALAAWSTEVEVPPADAVAEWRRRVVTHHDDLFAYVRQLGLAHAELVPVDLDVEEAGEIDRIDRAAGRGARSGRLRTLIEADLGRQPDVAPRWLVKAEPGAGKTTLLRQLAHDLAREDLTPLFVSLAEWEREGGDVFEAVLRQMGETILGASELRAHSGRFWLFLDGFDEVRRHEDMRRRVLALAADPRWRRVPVVVTSRAGAVERGAAWGGFTSAALRYLGAHEQEELVSRLLGGDAARIAAFDHDMRHRPGVAVLLRNPFLLTLAVGLHARARDQDAPVPCDRAALLVAALDDCMQRGWAHGEPTPERAERWSPVAARVVLRALALELHRRGGEAWSRHAVARALHTLPGRHPGVRQVYGHEHAIWKGEAVFLDDIQHYAGVLGPLDGGGMDWRFLHRSLLEMLAAEQLADESSVAERRAVLAELLAEKSAGSGGGPGRSGELIALLAARLLESGRAEAEAAEATGYLEALVRAAPDAAVRALAGVERVEPGAHLRLLLAVPPPKGEPWRQVGWDNDELDAVLDAIARGDGTRLWNAASAEQRLFELGVLWYGLERVETRGREVRAWTPEELEDRSARFFAATGLAERPRPTIKGISLGGGRFWMGRPEGVGEERERPSHEVRVAPFLLGVTPVTVAQLRAFTPDVGGGDELPATRVDWFTARLFAAWVGGRLPTEAEWEYACRAGTDTRWSCGDEEKALGKHAWYADNSGRKLHPVGQKRPNPFGLLDMHGNVWEWCESRYGPYPAAAARGPSRVLRGGSYWVNADGCRSAYRSWDQPVMRHDNVGFRVVLPAAPQPG